MLTADVLPHRSCFEMHEKVWRQVRDPMHKVIIIIIIIIITTIYFRHVAHREKE